MNQKLPKGIYVMETVSLEVYKEKYTSSRERAKHMGYGNSSSDVFERNSKNCNRIFRVHRKDIKFSGTEMVVNYAENGTILPNIIIKKVYTLEQAQEKYPEYLL